MKPQPQVERKLFDRSRPCFHCSKSLQQLPKSRGGKYVGFAMAVDGFERVFHQACIDPFLSGEPPETDDESFRPYPERIKELRASKQGQSV